MAAETDREPSAGADAPGPGRPFTPARTERGWRLVDAAGRPFFSLGVTHVLQILEQPLFQAAWQGDLGACVRDVTERLRAWGFNSLGYGSFHPRCTEFASRLPFFASVEVLRSARWLGDAAAFDDVYDPEWQAGAARRIREAFAPLAGHRNLVGVYWSDLPAWGAPLGSPSVVWDDYLRSLPVGSPGKMAWIRFLAERHPSFTRWRDTVGATGSSWEEIASTRVWPGNWLAPGEREDFLEQTARTYYSLCYSQTRHVLPHTLIFGDRYHSDDLVPAVLRAVSPFVDGLAIQPESGRRFDEETIGRASRIAGGRPVIICDTAVNFPTRQHPLTVWPPSQDSASAAREFASFVSDALESGLVLGVHRCTYIDLVKPGGILKQGLVDSEGNPHWDDLGLL